MRARSRIKGKLSQPDRDLAGGWGGAEGGGGEEVAWQGEGGMCRRD